MNSVTTTSHLQNRARTSGPVVSMLVVGMLLTCLQFTAARAQNAVTALPEQMVAELPDGRGMVFFSQPTRRYAHGILGDDIEAGGLTIKTDRERTFTLPPQRVFEDLVPRLHDLTGNGEPEILVIESHQDRGAAISVYRITADQAPAPLARSRWIGTANRWLNPVGVADFTGDGRQEIAVIQTPHIGGILILYRLQDGHLVEILRKEGFSNHDIGSRALGLSAIADWNCDGVPDILIPTQGKRGAAAITFRHTLPVVLDRTNVTELIVGNFSTDLTSDAEIAAVTLPLADGKIAKWTKNCR